MKKFFYSSSKENFSRRTPSKKHRTEGPGGSFVLPGHRMGWRGACAVEDQMEMRGGGTLTVCREGPRVRFHARRPADGRGLYKVWLHGERGGRFLLGTLAPEGDALTLTRTLSLGELERTGCWPQLRGECVLAFPFGGREEAGGWTCEEHPEALPADPVLRSAIRGPMLYRRGMEGFSLAAPFRPGRPFPLVPLFCLTRVERGPNGPRLVWDFDRAGRPKCP